MTDRAALARAQVACDRRRTERERHRRALEPVRMSTGALLAIAFLAWAVWRALL